MTDAEDRQGKHVKTANLLSKVQIIGKSREDSEKPRLRGAPCKTPHEQTCGQAPKQRSHFAALLHASRCSDHGMLITKAQVIAKMPVKVKKLTTQLDGNLGIYECLLDKCPAQAIERLCEVKRGLNATDFGGRSKGGRNGMPSGLLDVVSSAFLRRVN